MSLETELLGKTVRYRFDGKEYEAKVISTGATLFTVLDENGLRRVLHRSAVIEVLK